MQASAGIRDIRRTAQVSTGLEDICRLQIYAVRYLQAGPLRNNGREFLAYLESNAATKNLLSTGKVSEYTIS
jgi:hypothetical protein